MSQDVVLEVLREEHLSQMADICRDGFGSKRFMGCCAMSESAEKMKKRYSKYPRERWELCVVAVEGTTVLGFCQLSKQGLPTWPEGLHTCKAGEMYVELVAVGASARGKGVGGKLLEWCDEKAKNTPGITNLTLEVVGGNRAIGLYERRGYETIPQDPVDKCCTAMFVCCIFGRPYGCCDSGWGSMTMVKPMER